MQESLGAMAFAAMALAHVLAIVFVRHTRTEADSIEKPSKMQARPCLR